MTIDARVSGKVSLHIKERVITFTVDAEFSPELAEFLVNNDGRDVTLDMKPVPKSVPAYSDTEAA